VEQPLVVAALPAFQVEPRERVAAPLHAREAVLLRARLRLRLHARQEAAGHRHAGPRRLDGNYPAQHAAEQLQDLSRRARFDHLPAQRGVL